MVIREAGAQVSRAGAEVKGGGGAGEHGAGARGEHQVKGSPYASGASGETGRRNREGSGLFSRRP